MVTETSIDGDGAVVELSGKLTVQTSPELGQAIEQLPQSICNLDIDLTNVDYVASAGLRVLVAASKLAVKRGGRMRIVHPADGVMEVFEMTGLSEVLVIER